MSKVFLSFQFTFPYEMELQFSESSFTLTKVFECNLSKVWVTEKFQRKKYKDIVYLMLIKDSNLPIQIQLRPEVFDLKQKLHLLLFTLFHGKY